jgi:phosphoheptose isomerase
MKTKETYKDRISTEIRDLSESEIEKIIKIIHLLKTEFLGGKKEVSIKNFKKAKGAWKDINVERIFKKLNEDWKEWKPLKSV